MALKSEQKSEQGYISFDDNSYLIGKEGFAATVLRPSGKVEVQGDIYDAIAETGYIEQGEPIVINKCESGQVYVSKK